MKKLYAFVCVAAVLAGCASKKDTQQSLEHYNEIYSQLKEKDFFKARDAFEKNKKHIAKPYSLVLQAELDNAFNRLESSNKNIELVFKEYANVVPDSIKLELLETEQGNYGKLFEYDKAHNVITKMLDGYTQFMTEDEEADYRNTLLIWSAFKDQPKQEVIVKETTTIKMIRDKAQLTNLPVRVGSTVIDFIFDTGANYSTVTQTTAKDLNMKMLNGTIEVGTITGLTVNSQLAICPEFSMGGIVVKNAVFLVFPDEALSFPQADYHINGIIGYPVIEALREIQITRNDEFIVPKKPTDYHIQNMALDFLNPVIDINGDYYTFDSGAVGTLLYTKYIDKYKDSIIGKYEETDLEFGGAGGMKSKKGYIIVFSPVISGKQLKIDEVRAFSEKIDDKENHFYGNIGQDVIKKFEKMTLNFESMYIKFD